MPTLEQKIQHIRAELKALFYLYYRQKEYAKAQDTALAWHKICPEEDEPLSNAATCAIYCAEWDRAIDYAHQILERDPSFLNAYDVLSHAYYFKRDMAQCRQAGLKALTLRDERVMANGELPELPVPHSTGKNVIAFSLFGSGIEYLEGAVLNAQVVGTLYPGWVCRYYIDQSVPTDTVARLRQNNAEIVLMEGELAEKLPGTMWRFLAIDDSTIENVIFRDVDSVISWREVDIVNEWIASGKTFYTIRDSGSHTELILAGLWGAKGGAIPDITQKMLHYAETEDLDRRFADQFFLRHVVWQYVRQSLYASDSIFGFLNAHPFPDNEGNTPTGHVGTVETANIINVGCHYPENTRVKWQLFSQIDPVPRKDGSYPILEQERFICEYQAVVKDKKFAIPFPKRYCSGFATDHSRMKIEPINDSE